MQPRNPRSEAQDIVGSGYDARVLEPSPPAVDDGPFFADDPVSGDDRHVGNSLVVPTGVDGDLDWNEWLKDNPQHSDWVSARWLGGHRRLAEKPADLESTRESLHRLAMYVIAPVRYNDNGKFGLRYTLGGFGTPFFGSDRQIRVAGSSLIDQRGERVEVAPITTLAAAADFLETEIDDKTAAEHDSPAVGDVDADLVVDDSASAFIGSWIGMAFAALEAIRADAASVDPSRPQLWPGHFDPAIEVGDEAHRASYGASMGDQGIDEPYLYVSLWDAESAGVDGADPVWNADGFVGAVLRHSELSADTDPVVQVVEFMSSVRDRIGD